MDNIPYLGRGRRVEIRRHLEGDSPHCSEKRRRYMLPKLADALIALPHTTNGPASSSSLTSA